MPIFYVKPCFIHLFSCWCLIVICLCDKVSCVRVFASVECCQNVINLVLARKLMNRIMNCGRKSAAGVRMPQHNMKKT